VIFRPVGRVELNGVPIIVRFLKAVTRQRDTVRRTGVFVIDFGAEGWEKDFGLYFFYIQPLPDLFGSGFFFLACLSSPLLLKSQGGDDSPASVAHTIMKHKRVIKPFFDFSRKVVTAR